MITITLDGQIFSPDLFGNLQTLTVSGSVTDNGLQRQISSEIICYGTAYEYLKNIFVNNTNATTNEIKVSLVDDCCNEFDYSGIITFESVKWCYGDCSIRFKILEDLPEFQCFKSTVVSDNYNGFQDLTTHPRLSYCNELRPNWLMHVVLIIGILLNLILFALTPIVAVVSVIIQVICAIMSLPFIPGDCPEDLKDGILDDYVQMITNLNTAIVGCGRKHPTPLVRDYIQNVCKKCGLDFQSSILNNPDSEYYNTLWFEAQFKKGCKDCTTPIKENLPIITLDMMLDKLKPLFAADYLIRDNLLLFERRDKLKQQNIAFDFVSADKSKLVNLVCYEWNGKKKVAYMNASYQQDPIDIVGNEARNLYNDIVDFNIPYNQSFVGSIDLHFEFAPARFRNDGIEEDVLNAYKFYPYYSTIITQHEKALLMQQNTAMMPKLIIWDGIDYVNAAAKIYPTPNGYDVSNPQSEVNAPYQLYNYPYYVDAQYNSAQKNLYDFLQLEDPRNTFVKNITFELTFKYKCGDISKLNLLDGVVLDQGIGAIEDYTIDFYRHEIRIKGTL